MPSIQVRNVSAALSAPGTTSGYITVADSAPFYPGAEAWLIQAGASQRCRITDLKAGGLIGIRFLPNQDGRDANGNYMGHAPSYGRSDCSAYTVVGAARISMPEQIVAVEMNFTKKSLL